MNSRQITKSLQAQPADALWASLLAHAQTLQPFWERGVRTFAKRSALPREKRDAYLGTIATSFQKMDDWRRGRAKYVQARRNEIDSAISFLRNKAIEKSICGLCIAPAARNAASALRKSLYTACPGGYSDQHIPEILAGILYDIAAVRTLFPFDLGNLAGYHPGHDVPAPADPLVMMLKKAGKELGIIDAVKRLMREVDRIWNTFDTPTPMTFADDYWQAEGDGADARLHYQAIAEFHRT